MKRILKNMIVIIFIVILIALSFFTMRNAKKTLVKTILNDENAQMMGKKFDIPNGDIGNGKQAETPPDMPSEDSGNGKKAETPSDMPSEDSGNGKKTETSPNMSSENSRNAKYGEILSEMPDNMMQQNNEQEEVKLTTVYYVMFVGEAGLISILIVYLIMSCFNKKSIKETLRNKKIIIFVILVALLTAGVTFVEVTVADRIFLSSDSESNVQNQKEQKTDQGMLEGSPSAIS